MTTQLQLINIIIIKYILSRFFTRYASIFKFSNSHPKILRSTSLTEEVLHLGPTRHNRYDGDWGWGVEYICSDDLKKFCS
jgi:hypothetical protein